MAYTAKVKALIGTSIGLGLVVLVLAIIVLIQTIIKQNLELKTKQTKLTNNQTTEPMKDQIKNLRWMINPPQITGKDGAIMIKIPAGEFQMGGNESNDEKPVHTVYLDAFYIDKYEVTNALYKKFMDVTGHKAPYYWNSSTYNDPKQPVVGVNWNDAKAYADWAEERLPTEAEWEKSARGGLVGKRYPWGDEITHDNANYDGTGGKDVWNGLAPVGSFAPNGYGLYDMAGNVWEWCADWYDSEYYANSPKQNPKGPDTGRWRVLRGGSWGSFYDYVNNLRVAGRDNGYPSFGGDNVGFRCVQ